MHIMRQIQLYRFKRCNDVLYSYYKKILFTTRAKSLRPRDRPTLGPAAPILMRVDHSVRKVQLYAHSDENYYSDIQTDRPIPRCVVYSVK